MRSQFAKTMLEVGQADEQLFVLVADIGAFGLREFAAECPGRFLNAGIREQALASAAAGLAMTGFVPVIHSITPFIVERCFEQIKVGLALHSLPGNIVSVGGGIDYSALGCTHHSYSDIALLKSIPGTQVFCLGSPVELDELFKQTYKQGTVNYFRLGGRSHGVEIDRKRIRAGKGILLQEGSDLTVLASGSLLGSVVQAVKDARISCEILYYPSIKPFDAELLRASVGKSGRLVVVEDHNVLGGIADEARRALMNLPQRYSMVSLGIQDQFMRDYGTPELLASQAGISPAHILAAMNELMRNE